MHVVKFLLGITSNMVKRRGRKVGRGRFQRELYESREDGSMDKLQNGRMEACKKGRMNARKGARLQDLRMKN